MILFNIMHTKSHPRNSEIAQAVGTYALDPVYRRVARDVRVMAMYWVEGARSPQPMIWAEASPTHLHCHGLASNHGSFFFAGTGIPEYSGDSGVIRDSDDQPKGGSCKKIPPEKTRIQRNPEESWQE